jgi:hypothetical protein
MPKQDPDPLDPKLGPYLEARQHGEHTIRWIKPRRPGCEDLRFLYHAEHDYPRNWEKIRGQNNAFKLCGPAVHHFILLDLKADRIYSVHGVMDVRFPSPEEKMFVTRNYRFDPASIARGQARAVEEPMTEAQSRLVFEFLHTPALLRRNLQLSKLAAGAVISNHTTKRWLDYIRSHLEGLRAAVGEQSTPREPVAGDRSQEDSPSNIGIS